MTVYLPEDVAARLTLHALQGRSTVSDVLAEAAAAIVGEAKPPAAGDELPALVYFLERRDGAIKIGTTRDLNTRLSAIRRDAGDVRVLGTIDGDVETEREFHARFLRFRMDGEWFAPNPEMLAAIAEAMGR